MTHFPRTAAVLALAMLWPWPACTDAGASPAPAQATMHGSMAFSPNN